MANKQHPVTLLIVGSVAGGQGVAHHSPSDPGSDPEIQEVSCRATPDNNNRRRVKSAPVATIQPSRGSHWCQRRRGQTDNCFPQVLGRKKKPVAVNSRVQDRVTGVYVGVDIRHEQGVRRRRTTGEADAHGTDPVPILTGSRALHYIHVLGVARHKRTGANIVQG